MAFMVTRGIKPVMDGKFGTAAKNTNYTAGSDLMVVCGGKLTSNSTKICGLRIGYPGKTNMTTGAEGVDYEVAGETSLSAGRNLTCVGFVPKGCVYRLDDPDGHITVDFWVEFTF